jgi:hypothetical protein
MCSNVPIVVQNIYLGYFRKVELAAIEKKENEYVFLFF